MILLIDNYDSFVHNLARYFQRLGHETCVLRNDVADVARVKQLAPAAVVLSPGPCTPELAGHSLDVVSQLWEKIPMLGVCLGHQTIAAAFGARVVRAPEPMHGRTSQIAHTASGVFAGLDNPLTVCRYHSLIVDRRTLPGDFEVTAWLPDGVIMGIRHRRRPLVGLQFHPEAILTEGGFVMLANFLRSIGLPATLTDSLNGELLEPPRRDVSPTSPVTF